MIKIVLRDLLHERNMNQAELSRISGVRPTTINVLYKNDTNRLSLPALEKICIALGCTPNDIIKIEPDAEEDK